MSRPRKSRGIFNESATQNDMAGALAPRLSFAPNPARYILTGTLGLGSRNPPPGLAAHVHSVSSFALVPISRHLLYQWP
jgi:hypothetical protein